jgi:hypothetical protein
MARRAQCQVGERSARLARELMTLSGSALGALRLDDELREKVDRARPVTAHVARRRAERSLAGELRRADRGPGGPRRRPSGLLPRLHARPGGERHRPGNSANRNLPHR